MSDAIFLLGPAVAVLGAVGIFVYEYREQKKKVAGERQLVEGRTVLDGKVQPPRDQFLQAPFSARPCVAYELTVLTRQRINTGNQTTTTTQVIHRERGGRVRIARADGTPVGEANIADATFFPPPDLAKYPLPTTVYVSNTSSLAPTPVPPGVQWFLGQRGLPQPSTDSVFVTGGLQIIVDEKIVVPGADVFAAGEVFGRIGADDPSAPIELGVLGGVPMAWGLGSFAQALRRHQPSIVNTLVTSVLLGAALGTMAMLVLSLAFGGKTQH